MYSKKKYLIEGVVFFLFSFLIVLENWYVIEMYFYNVSEYMNLRATFSRPCPTACCLSEIPTMLTFHFWHLNKKQKKMMSTI